MSSKKNKITSMAAALAVALAPVPASSIVHHDLSISRHSTSTLSLQDVKDSVAYLPIDEATSYMLNLADRMKTHRANLRIEWEEKQIPIILKNQKKETQEGFESLFRHIAVCASFVEAARVALKSVPESNAELRKEIVAFARSAATLRYTIEDILSFIESTHVPKKTSDADLGVTADQVRALIRSEHKKLGLKDPTLH
ncbi:hypothetical protein HUI25_005013 [Escherichia coli]|nr:hypothetical protein [Escherichia coli]